MKYNRANQALCGELAALALGFTAIQQADACTRAVYPRRLGWVDNFPF